MENRLYNVGFSTMTPSFGLSSQFSTQKATTGRKFPGLSFLFVAITTVGPRVSWCICCLRTSAASY